MGQALIMCILDYDFNVLSSAFLVHRPDEFKSVKKDRARERIRANQSRFVRRNVTKEIEALYGTRKGCKM